MKLYLLLCLSAMVIMCQAHTSQNDHNNLYSQDLTNRRFYPAGYGGLGAGVGGSAAIGAGLSAGIGGGIGGQVGAAGYGGAGAYGGYPYYG